MHLEGINSPLHFCFLLLLLLSNRISHDCIYYLFIYLLSGKVSVFKILIYESEFLPR